MTKTNDGDQPLIEIRLVQGSLLPIAQICLEYGIPEDDVLRRLQHLLTYSWTHFGTKCFQLEFDSQRGYVIRALAAVGFIADDYIRVLLEPKIQGVGLEKALAMSQSAGDSRFKVGNKQVSASISDAQEYPLVDLLGFAFCDSVMSLLRGGLVKNWKDESSRGWAINGPIDVQAFAEQGGSPPPTAIVTADNFNVSANRVICSALAKVSKTSRNPSLISLSNSLYSTLSELGIKSLDVQELNSETLSLFTTPRPDYEITLGYANSLLLQGQLNFDGISELIPNFTMDMDYVFENFCSFQLAESLDKAVFEVKLQFSFNHNATPELSGRSFVPDIYVKNLLSGKKAILDVKHKFADLETDGKPTIGNADLFQQFYYQQSLGADIVIALYPTVKPVWEFPLPKSEALAQYSRKGDEAMMSEALPKLVIDTSASSMTLFQIQIDLSGSLKNSIDSVKRVAFMIQKLLA